MQKNGRYINCLFWCALCLVIVVLPMQAQNMRNVQETITQTIHTEIVNIQEADVQKADSSVLDSLLTVFEREVKRTDEYLLIRQARIDSLSALRPRTPSILLAIAREYQAYQSDSSCVYYTCLRNEAAPYDSEAAIGLVQIYAAMGRYEDGIAVIASVSTMPKSHRLRWYEAARRLYSDGAQWTTIPSLKQSWKQEAAHYRDSLMNAWREAAPKDSHMALLLAQYSAMDAQNIETALEYNAILLSNIDSAAHEYAIKAYERAMLYKQAGDDNSRREWLIRSAIQDVRCAVRDNGSSWLVAKDCYKDGDLDRAYLFCSYSLTNASFFNSPTRFIQTYKLGHTISNDHKQQLKAYSLRLTVLLVGLLILLVVVFVVIGFIWWYNSRLHVLHKEMKQINMQLQMANKQLKDANMVKEQYICRYLEVYSDYIRRLTSMARKAGEKDPTAFMNREMAHFYRSFDDTFLSLYGSFVQDFNALLRPDARLTPKKGERMTIEMRIFALILLGIDNSARIAELLCYSPNTISNYRVKMKNNALGDRAQFEAAVRAIGALC